MSARAVVRDVILRDGGTLRLRSPTAADRDEIESFFDRLSPQSRFMRFHGYTPPSAAARLYADSDGDARVALIARHADGAGADGAGRIVAVAGYSRLREPDVAEVAFAVADDQQGRGTGTRLLEQLAALATERGIRRFDAWVLSDNRPMLGVFASAGFEVRRRGRGGEVELHLDLRPTEFLAERVAARNHEATVASLRPLLAPRAVAVVGASAEPESVGGAIFSGLVERNFTGTARPVNRSGGAVAGVPAVRSVAELDGPPDLAVLVVPATEVVALAHEAGRAGVRALSVVASGFSDAGEEGRAREERLLEVVREHGMRLLGPNSLGLVNTDPGVSLDATVGHREVLPGGVALSSQSGALGLALLGHTAARDVGVAAFVSLGNRADVSTNDLLELWEDDPRVLVVTLYVESFGNPRRFSQIARRVSRRKPIVVVKGNRARPGVPGRGARHDAAGPASHTAAALRGEAVVEALFRQAGVLRVGGAEELFDTAQVLAGQPLPAGRSVAVLTNSGGLGTLAADACQTRGLALAELSEATAAHLRASLPRAHRTTNPVDMAIPAQPAHYSQGIEALLADDAVDAVLVLYADLGGGDPGGVVEAAERAAADAPKPVVASVLDARGHPPAREGPAGRPGAVPNLRFVDACAAGLARAADRREWLSRPLGQRPVLDLPPDEEARARLRPVLGAPGWVGAEEVSDMLAAYGLAVAPAWRCAGPDDAVAAGAGAGGPVALKAYFPPPGLAGDLDAVMLGVEGEPAIRSAWETLRRRVAAAGRSWHGAQVQPLIGAGADVLVGALADPDLGPVMALGMGGRQAGLASDVAFRLRPETDVDVDDLIDGAPGVRAVLGGFRGNPSLDREALGDLILRFGALLRAFPEIVESDLNPVRLTGEGYVVLDARMRVEHRPGAERVKTW